MVYDESDWPGGLRCGECQRELETGDTIAERLEGMFGGIPIVEIICGACDIVSAIRD